MAGMLECECGSTLFIHVHQIRHMQNGAVADQVAGRQCVKCGKPVDTQTLVKAHELKVKKSEVQRLAEEIARNVTPKTGPAEKSRTSGSGVDKVPS